MKKLIITLILIITLFTSTLTTALAASSDVWAKWYTGNAGSVSGNANGVYHSLKSGKAYLKGYVNGATSRYPVVAILYEEKTLFDKKFETVHFTSEQYETHLIGQDIPTSNKFYLEMGAGKHDIMHIFEGTLSNSK